MTIRLALLALLLMNTVTAAIYKIYYMLANKDDLFTHVRQHLDNSNNGDDGINTNYFLIPGFLNQSVRSFAFLDKLLEHNCDIYYMDYDNHGYDPEHYAERLFDKVTEVTKEQKKSGKNIENTAISISMGDQILDPVSEVFDQIITINPCTYNVFLSSKYRALITIASPFLLITEFLLGWLSFMPMIQADYNYFSVALIADQLSAMKVWSPPDSPRLRNRSKKILLSKYDQFLDNQAIERYYNKAKIKYIDCMHGTMADPNDAQIYMQGLQKLCDKKTITDYPYPWTREKVR